MGAKYTEWLDSSYQKKKKTEKCCVIYFDFYKSFTYYIPLKTYITFSFFFLTLISFTTTFAQTVD